MINIEIDQKQLQKILQKADPQAVKKEMAELMKDAGHYGRAAAMHNLSGGSEQAKISMRFDAEPLSARVYSVMPQARVLSIEEGRKPGAEVPYMQAARHVTGRRYLTQRRLSELSDGDREQIERFLVSVRSSGAKGKRFIAGAKAAVLKDIPGMLTKVARNIEGRWVR